MLGISKFWHKDRQQASGRLLAHRPPTYYHHPYKVIIIRETKYDLKQILFGSLHIHLDYSFEGGNPSWKIDKVNLTSILSCSWYVCMQARTQGIFPTILPLKNVIDFGNFCPLLNYTYRHFSFHYFFPFWKEYIIEHCVKLLLREKRLISFLRTLRLTAPNR